MSNELKKMDNSMLPISESAPANIVYQQGEKNVHIDHADSVQQNVQMVFMGFSAAADGTMQPTYKTINREYYNLFVVGDELTPNEPFVLTPDRVLPAYWTEENVRAEYGSLSAEAIEKIKTFPSLFMAETRKYRAQSLFYWAFCISGYIHLCIKDGSMIETAVVSGFLMILMDECISDLND